MVLSAYSRLWNRRSSEAMHRFFTQMGFGKSRIQEGRFFCPFYGEIFGRHSTRNFLGNGSRRRSGGQLGGLAGGNPRLEGRDLGASANSACSLSEKPSQVKSSWSTRSGLGFAGGTGGRGIPLGSDRPFSSGCDRRLPGSPKKANSTAVDRSLESNGTRSLGCPSQGGWIRFAASLPAYGDLLSPKEMNPDPHLAPLREGEGEVWFNFEKHE